MGSSFWNAWLNQGLPVTFQATGGKDLFIIKGLSSSFGFFETPGDIGSRKVKKMTLQEDLDTRVEFAMLELSVLLYWLSPLLFCKVLSELTKAGEMLWAVNYYHKALHLGCCSSPRSASGAGRTACVVDDTRPTNCVSCRTVISFIENIILHSCKIPFIFSSVKERAIRIEFITRP